MQKLSIVVPAFNEASRLVNEVSRLDHAVAVGAIDPFTTELIVVDDGSTDDTARRAKELLARSFPVTRVLRLRRNLGKGAAIRVGVAAAAAPIVAFLDADMAVDPVQMPHLVAAIHDAEMAIGSRSVPGSSVDCDSIRRALMGRTFNHLANALTEVSLGDTQCGFKAFRTPVARILFHCMVINRFAFDVEVLSLARRFGFRIAEVPVHWRDVEGSTVRPISDPLSMVLDVLRMRKGKKSPRIPALAINVDSNRDGSPSGAQSAAIIDAVGPALPVLALPQDQLMILFALSQPNELQRVTERLGKIMPKSTFRDLAISPVELCRLAPLTLLPWDGVSHNEQRSVGLSTSSSPMPHNQLNGGHNSASVGPADPGPSFLAGT